MPYRKETPLAPFTMWRFLKERTGMRVSKETARIYAEIMSEIGMKIARLAVMNAKKEGRMTVYNRDIRNAIKNPAWRERFVHGQEVCSKCERLGYVVIKVPKRTPEKMYAYVYCKHGFGSVRQCILGRLIVQTPLASRDGDGH